jgi:hypothetical protein
MRLKRVVPVLPYLVGTAFSLIVPGSPIVDPGSINLADFPINLAHRDAPGHNAQLEDEAIFPRATSTLCSGNSVYPALATYTGAADFCGSYLGGVGTTTITVTDTRTTQRATSISKTTTLTTFGPARTSIRGSLSKGSTRLVEHV